MKKIKTEELILKKDVKKSLKWVAFWMVLALLFNVGVYFFMGGQAALEFLGGYIIELSLSVDNLFLFITLFTAFNVPIKYQHRVLTYGIAGAIILRLIFILLGVTIVTKFEWVLYLFGFILILSGIKMFRDKGEEKDIHDSKVLKVFKKIMPVTDDFHEQKFFVRVNGILHATPLFAVLIMIECSDILFAIDSVPAVFSVTTNTFLVYTSNIFAILGLRNLYFVLADLHERFQYVKYGVATILTYTGCKLALLMFGIHVPTLLSIILIISILVISVVASIYATKNLAK